MTTKVRYCAECRYDNGIHYSDDGTTFTRPHLEAAVVEANHLAIVELAHEEQTKQARRIVEWAAETMLEFSANQVRQQMDDAGIEGPVVGAAFKWAETNGILEATGRAVQSTDPKTRHRLNVWRSRVHRLSAPVGAA